MKEKKQLPQWLIPALFPAVLIYYETVLRLFSIHGIFHSGTVYTLLFCLVYGLIGWLFATVSSRKWVNFTVSLVFVTAAMVPFLVEYFVYRQFKIFYDLNTMLAGASDALTDYRKELFAMVFTWEGIGCILLFLLPPVAYGIFGWRYSVPEKLNWTKRLATGALCIAVFGGALFGISRTDGLSRIYEKEYNYQDAVGSFGLLTGLRLDVPVWLSGGTSGGFEIEEPPVIPTIPQPTTTPTQPPQETTAPEETLETTAPTEPPVVYTPNALDIDFASLKASGTKKELNAYLATLTPTMKNEYTGLFAGKNLIFITAEAFSAEVIDPQRTPTLYRLATQGMQFTDFYQPCSAGTTGGEYQNLFGLQPTAGGESLKETADHLNYFTMGSQLDRLGYYGKAFHNHSAYFYDRHKTHKNLGYSDGFMGMGKGMEKYVKETWPESDVSMFKGTLPTYIDKQPFNVYYMTVSGHSNYNRWENYMSDIHWDRVADLDYSSTVKGYLAANMELEDSLTYLVAELEKAGIADDTVVVIASDHYPYGLSKAALAELYGFEYSNYLERDHSRLIIWSGCLEDQEPIVVDTPTSSLDILPTLSNLFGTAFDSRLMPGRDVFSEAPALVFNMNYDWKTEYGTYISKTGKFTPADPELVIPEGYVESIKTIVRNKMRLCSGILITDYYRYLFG